MKSTYRIEPLQKHHDRSSFCCGIEELDRYLSFQATQDAKRKVAAPFVMVETIGKVVGYYTLSGYGLHLAELPADIAKKLPKYPVLPVTLLGRRAVDHSRQGEKLGQILLMDALHRSLTNTAQVASIGVLVEAINDKAKAFYLHHEFRSVLEHPNKLFLPMQIIVKLFPAVIT